MKKEEYYFWLTSLPGIGTRKAHLLLDTYGPIEDLYHMKKDEAENLAGFSAKDKLVLSDSKLKENAKIQFEKLKAKRVEFVHLEDDRYPGKLRHIFDAPIGLYVRGELPKAGSRSIAIVGARNCSNYGKEMARYFARELGKAGIHVISGLARGIDSFAHAGALEGGGSTVGVLGCGIDICYPQENIELYMQMQGRGAILSEYGLGVSAKPGFFPMRNRIISGMSDGVLVIEAKEKSGSLITVDMGLEQGKNIYAVPGRTTDVLSSGCNNLIRMGAKITINIEDILEDLVANYENMCLDMYCDLDRQFKKTTIHLETNEKIVYDRLSFTPKHMEEIILDTNMDIKEAMEALIHLQLKDYVKQVGSNYYVLSS